MRGLGWQSLEKILRIPLTLFIVSLVARHLGPANLGTLSLGLSIIGFAAAISTLGLDHLLTRELVKNAVSGGTLLGTAFLMTALTGALLAAVTFIISIGLTDLPKLRLVLMILSGTLVARSTTIFGSWFRANLRLDCFMMAGVASFAIASVWRLTGVYFHLTVFWFAWASVLERLSLGIILICLFLRLRKPEATLQFDAALGLKLLSVSWPYILASLVNGIHRNIDQLMIGILSDRDNVGYYAAASRLSEFLYIIPVMFSTVLMPYLVRAREASIPLYTSRVRQYFRVNTLLAYLVIVPVSLFSSWLIDLLYGSQYDPAKPIILIHVWSCLFIYLNVAKEQVLLTENLILYSFLSQLGGATLNIFLNLWLIPLYQGPGAAMATLVSYAFTAIGTAFLYKKTRKMGLEQCLAIVFPVPRSLKHDT